MNISVKELKEKEGSKVEEISWNILNRMRELGNTSVYGGFCLSYVAYLSLKNNSYLVVNYLGTIPPPGGFWTGTTGYESLRISLSAPSNSKKEFD